MSPPGFTGAVASGACAAARRVASERGLGTVVLSGGVFQNRRLLESTAAGAHAGGTPGARPGAAARQRRRDLLRTGGDRRGEHVAGRVSRVAVARRGRTSRRSHVASTGIMVRCKRRRLAGRAVVPIPPRRCPDPPAGPGSADRFPGRDLPARRTHAPHPQYPSPQTAHAPIPISPVTAPSVASRVHRAHRPLRARPER